MPVHDDKHAGRNARNLFAVERGTGHVAAVFGISASLDQTSAPLTPGAYALPDRF